MTDLQDMDRLRSQLTSLEELQELLLYIVTHDLRSPMMTILGFADLLATDSQSGSGTSNVQEYTERIRQAASRQTQIIEELQQLVKLAPLSIELRRTDLSELIRQQSKLLHVVPPNTKFDIEPDCRINCDVALMSSAVNALLSNAVKLASSSNMPTVKFVAIRNATSSQHCFQIQSNGTGFELGPDQRLLGFFRCLQSDGSMTGSASALLHAAFVLYRHGGKLWIKSDPSHGTTANFSLPG